LIPPPVAVSLFRFQVVHNKQQSRRGNSQTKLVIIQFSSSNNHNKDKQQPYTYTTCLSLFISQSPSRLLCWSCICCYGLLVRRLFCF